MSHQMEEEYHAYLLVTCASPLRANSLAARARCLGALACGHDVFVPWTTYEEVDERLWAEWPEDPLGVGATIVSKDRQWRLVLALVGVSVPETVNALRATPSAKRTKELERLVRVHVPRAETRVRLVPRERMPMPSPRASSYSCSSSCSSCSSR